VNPFEEYRITSPYGWRDSPTEPGTPEFHPGIDMVKNHLDPLYCFVAGEVIFAGEGLAGTGFGGYGNVVAIKDKLGHLHCYCHLAFEVVEAGAFAEKGTMIGRQGNTGKVTGSHLHYEIRKKLSPSFGWIKDKDKETMCFEPTEYLKNYYEGKEEKGMFKDVNDNSWYAKGVYEAVQLGLFAGLSKEEFGVGKPLAREEAANVFVRLYKLIASGFAGVVEKVLPAVVEINIGGSLGSGTIIHPDGYILTNHHVVKDNTEVYVLSDRNNPIFDGVDNIKGQVLVFDTIADLALVKVDTKDKLPYLSLSTEVHQGENVLAVGNPIGFTDSVSHGIVSAFRVSKGITHIQTDAEINPGNSGGALVNNQGQLIGVPAYKFDSLEGLAFAVSADEVREFVAKSVEVKGLLKELINL